MKRITEKQLSAILYKHDHEGLASMGAPEDEYDSEAEMLWDCIETHREIFQANPSLLEIAETLEKIYVFMFSDVRSVYGEGFFMDCAKEIHSCL